MTETRKETLTLCTTEKEGQDGCGGGGGGDGGEGSVLKTDCRKPKEWNQKKLGTQWQGL